MHLVELSCFPYSCTHLSVFHAIKEKGKREKENPGEKMRRMIKIAMQTGMIDYVSEIECEVYCRRNPRSCPYFFPLNGKAAGLCLKEVAKKDSRVLLGLKKYAKKRTSARSSFFKEEER